jgi:cysteinyl-tRNA synthetase
MRTARLAWHTTMRVLTTTSRPAPRVAGVWAPGRAAVASRARPVPVAASAAVVGCGHPDHGHRHLSASASAASASTAPPAPPALQPVALPSPRPGPPLPPLSLYNTATRAKAPFTPRSGSPPTPASSTRPPVSLYCCGVTVYDLSHVGHARVYVSVDILVRILSAAGYDVAYVRNFTDVDDKIIGRAAVEAVETGSTPDPAGLAERMIAEFHADMAALGCLSPSAEPRATAFVPAMVAMIERILNAGHGYTTQSGDVMFDVASLPGYGRLSGRDAAADNRAGERVAVDASKKSPFDFVLWKAAKPGEPTWDSPWGPGRPGWHIECSAMARDLCGPVVDIHAGGRDLIHPHHDNEVAQCQAAACECDRAEMPGGVDFVRWWVHFGFVTAAGGDKMSKSLGNFFTIRDAARVYSPSAIRLFLVSTHYRSPVGYSPSALEAASGRLFYVYQTLADAEAALAAAGQEGADAVAAAVADLQAGVGPGGVAAAAAAAALADDLNTPAAVAALSAPLKAANDLVHTKKGKKAPGRLADLASIVGGIRCVLAWLGLDPAEGEGGGVAGALADLRARALVRAGLTAADVEAAIAARAAARAAKDWATADAERVKLEAVGLALLDGPTGTEWRPAVRDLDEAEEEDGGA